MQNPIDEEFSKLNKESKEIVKKINKLMLDYKKMDDKLNFGLINDDFTNLIETNISKCNELGNKIMQKSQRIVIFGLTSVGKSSFINALMFQSKVLPVGSASKNKCFLEIRQSETNANYLTVDNKTENFQNIKNILCNEMNKDASVKLFYNFNDGNSFGKNIVIDTPGIDYSNNYNKKILKYCKEADISILVLNASTYFGNSMEAFCKQCNNEFSKINLYVVFNYCDVVQQRDDWFEGIEETIEILLKIFPTASREKMAFICSSERMDILTQNKDISNDELAKGRNASFQELSVQLTNERGQASFVGRYENLLNILEITKINLLCLSQMMNEQSVFFDNLRMLSNLPLFKQQIDKIVLSYCEIILKKSRKIISNKQTNCDVRTTVIVNVSPTDDENNDQNNDTTNDSDTAPLIINENPNDDAMKQSEIKRIQQGIQLLLNKVENEIKRKVMEEIINFIRSNIGDDKDTIIFVIKNIYFPTIMKKRYLVDYNKVIECVKEKSSRLKMGIGAAAGGLALGVACATIPLWPIMLPFELATGAAVGISAAAAAGGITIGGGLGAVGGKVVNELSEKISKIELKIFFLKKFAKDLVMDFSYLKEQTKNYLNLEKHKEQIKKQINDFETKMVLFQITGETNTKNKIDEEFTDLFKESKGIIEKINKFLIIYKNIDNDVNVEFGNEDFLELLKSDIKEYKSLGRQLLNNSKKIVFFGEAGSGKSSLINALIFQSNVLPVSSVSTKCFVEIKRSINNDNYLIVDEQRENIKKLKEIITNEENKERKIYLFHCFEKSNAFSNSVVIDSPGLSCDDYYGKRMSKYLNEADFVILVINIFDNNLQIIKEFIEKFNIELQQNFYVVFSFCENLQSPPNYNELIENKIASLTKIFPNVDRMRMAYICSLERMNVIEKKKKIFEDRQMEIRNISFEKLSKQIKSKSDEISFHYRHDFILKLLAILNDKRSRFSEVLREQFPLPNVNFNILRNFSFEEEIEKIIKSFYIKFLLKACKDIDNNYENITLVENKNENLIKSDETVIKTLMKKTENEIKQKLKEEIINYIDRSDSNYQNEIKSIVNEIYFPNVIDKKQFVYSEGIVEDVREITNKIKTALNDSRNATHFSIIFTKIPLLSVLIPIRLAADISTGTNVERLTVETVPDKHLNIFVEQNSLGNSMNKFGDDLIYSYSKFRTKRIKYSDSKEIESQITEEIDKFTMHVSSFKQKYLK